MVHTRRGKFRSIEGGHVDDGTPRPTNPPKRKRRVSSVDGSCVALLRERIAAGEYEIDFEQLAEKLLDFEVLDGR